MIVLDSSALVEWLLQRPKSAAVDKHLSTVRSVHAPYLIDIEVLHALRQLVRGGVVSPSRAMEAIEDFRNFRIRRYPHSDFIDRIWSLRDNLTAYDAVYVALAEELDAPLVTCDGKMAAAPGNRANILLVP